MRGRVLLAGCAAILLRGTASAQGNPESLPSGLGAAQQAAIVALGDSLRSEGLPWQLLYDKAREGALKGAGEDRIVLAVRSLAQRLRTARAELGAGSSPAELSAAASALYAGIPAEALRRTAALRAGERREVSLAVPLTMLADLVSRGVAASEAVAWIDTLLQRGAQDRDFNLLWSSIGAQAPGDRPLRDVAHDQIEQTLKSLDTRRPPPAPPGG